jgi:hypothetical protein
VGGYAPRALKESVRPLHSLAAFRRPLNFTVRPLFGRRASHWEYLHESRTHDHGI